MTRILGLSSLVMTFLLAASLAGAATYVPLDDYAYSALARLEAEGVIQSGLTSMKPLSRKEMARLAQEAEKNSEGKSEYIRAVARYLAQEFADEIRDVKFFKPVNSVYARYIYNSSDSQALNYNNNGDDYRKGSNERVGFDSFAELGWFSVYVNPELRYPDNDTEPIKNKKSGAPVPSSPQFCGSDCNAMFTSEKGADVTLKSAYGVISFLGLDLTVGKDAQWWGPGYHGSLILSNNAEPFTMVRLENPQPVLLPWIFQYLGPFRWTFFVTQLEDDRNDFPHPFFWGMRIDLKPHPYVEIGLQRTAILCGEGRKCNADTWWKSFVGHDNSGGKTGNAGDQIAGFDVKVTLPFRLQPLQLYTEIDGEDEAGGLPSRLGYLYGIYLPRILSAERLGLRVEYATDHIGGHPFYWYTHTIYTSGYTYDGSIIGDHMGSDSNDFFAQLSYQLSAEGDFVAVAYDREEHNLSDDIRPKKNEVSLSAGYHLMKNLKMDASYGHARLTDFEGIAGDNRNADMVTIGLKYTF